MDEWKEDRTVAQLTKQRISFSWDGENIYL